MIIKSLNKKDVEVINRICSYYVKLGNSDIIRGNSVGFYALSKDHVKRFCVHPDYRKHGTGTLLHEDLIKIARQHGHKRIIMLIHEESEAVSWFRNHWGWEGVGVKRDAFGNRDGYIMERRII